MAFRVLNLHLYPTSMTHESRILKETQAIASFGAFEKVILVGTTSSGLPGDEALDGGRAIVRLPRIAPAWLPPAARKAAGIAGWSAQVFRRFDREQLGCINCHSLSVLPVGVALKKRTGARLIYDPHELETEANGLGLGRRIAAKAVERALYPSADAVIVVGDDIADWYEAAYGGPRPAVVKNFPPRRSMPRSDRLRESLGLPQDATVFLYQGILGAGRGIELMLDAFSGSDDPRKVLVLLGMGPLEPVVAARAREAANIRFHPAVRPDELLEYTASADIGLCLIEDTCLSYRHCVPNKLFEYLAAGVPPIVSSLPEIARMVSRYAAGWVLPSWSPAELRSLVASTDAAAVAVRRVGAEQAARVYTWESQVPVLRAVYDRLGFTTAGLAGGAGAPASQPAALV